MSKKIKTFIIKAVLIFGGAGLWLVLSNPPQHKAAMPSSHRAKARRLTYRPQKMVSMGNTFQVALSGDVSFDSVPPWVRLKSSRPCSGWVQIVFTDFDLPKGQTILVTHYKISPFYTRQDEVVIDPLEKIESPRGAGRFWRSHTWAVTRDAKGKLSPLGGLSWGYDRRLRWRLGKAPLTISTLGPADWKADDAFMQNLFS